MSDPQLTPNFNAFSAAIFDLDGTLVQSEHVWKAAKVEVLRQYGVSPSRAQLDAHVGRGLKDFLDEVFGRTLSAAEHLEIGNRIGARADVLLPDMREPIAGATELLCQLHDLGLRIAICTSSPRRHAVSALEMLQISDRVELIVSGSELPRGKPDPLPYTTTVSELGVPPDSACAFEDSIAGTTSALSAGLTVLAIGPGCTAPAFWRCAYRAERFVDLRGNGFGSRPTRGNNGADKVFAIPELGADETRQ